ncbi:MAG: hypothetical protein A2Y21_03000 [Clostridiales bacterium GWC2_40_7]|nr:MAG: hypothetical protein A2Y21_03000 [Clostridiales bacterium GWC2_40_7]
MTRLQNTVERIKLDDPNHTGYTNLFPTYASSQQLGFSTFDGSYVSLTHPIGQSFKTNSKTTSISKIQLWIDRNQWSTSELLTLKLWNSAAKTTLLGQSTLNGWYNNFPQFSFSVNVSPNTTYYMELTHGGGGDNYVGWVVKCLDGEDWEKYGTAYNGSQQRLF